MRPPPLMPIHRTERRRLARRGIRCNLRDTVADTRVSWGVLSTLVNNNDDVVAPTAELLPITETVDGVGQLGHFFRTRRRTGFSPSNGASPVAASFPDHAGR